MTHHAHLPGAPARNGLPVTPFYVYRGNGHDQMPHVGDEELKLYKVDYSHWLPEFSRGGRELQPHGSPAAVRRHFRNNEKLCPPCAQAQRELNQGRARGSIR